MDDPTDYDLEELESRLYSQVFHSAEKWEEESPSVTQGSNINNPPRHVTTHVVNNTPKCSNRYWDANINNNSQIVVPNNLVSLEEFITLSKNDQINPSSLEPASNGKLVVQEYRTRPLRYNKILIPPTMKLPKAKVKRFPEDIVHFFELYNHKCRTQFRRFLRKLEKGNKKKLQQNNKLNDATENIPSTIIVTTNGNDRNYLFSDIPTTPQTKKSIPAEEIRTIETITLSDSDSDSVIEVPLPPVPVYNVDTSSESETDGEEILSTEKQSVSKEINSQPSTTNNVTVTQQKNEKNSKKIGKSTTINHNTSFTELEKERDEYLHTPDSNTNDFLEHDVNTLNKSTCYFNFGLHSSDLDLTKDKDEPTKSTHVHDLYETESSCSEISTANPKTKPVFNEINFESPTKDIFCEPDLSKFSNFITPNRNAQLFEANKKISQVKTKALKKSKEKEETQENDRRRSRSESSEYHSDATTLKSTKKIKKSKKKAKKKAKQVEAEDTEIPEKISEEKSTENNETSYSESVNTENVENRENTELSNETEEIENTSLTSYYKDTYFADDTWIIEELGMQERSVNEKNTEIEDPNTTENVASQPKSNNTFSFMKTWQKSVDKDCNTPEKKFGEVVTDELPIKKIKTNDSPTIVTINSSEDEKSRGSPEIVEITGKTPPRVVTIDDDSSDIIIVNVKNDNNNPTIHNQFSFMGTYMQNKEKKSFKDYWTIDMNKFYNESSGQENFDVTREQSSMSGSRGDWIICQEDMYGISRRKRGPACPRCRQFGHLRTECTKYNGPIICSICGYDGHPSTRCPNTICTNCRSPTSSLTSSCGRCSHFHALQCNICNTIGHETKYCPDLWRRYHLTTKNDPVLNASSNILKSPSDRWCSNCARRGHSEDKCSFLRSYPYYPSSAGIISYVPTYDGTFQLPNVPPAPNIPMFKDSNITLTDLRNIRRNVVHDNHMKYNNILKQLRQQCNKYDFQLINQIERLQKSINTHDFSKKKIQEIYKIRARIQKHKIS